MRRMFTDEITGSDAFTEMPQTSQLLYFHLGMAADDDGFIGSPIKLIRAQRLGEDDFKVLLAKRFIIVFEGGVCVIKHWRMANQLRWDRYKPTRYTELRDQLRVKENGAYTTDKSKGVELPQAPKQAKTGQNGNQLATSWQPVGNPVEYSIGKISIRESSTLAQSYLMNIPEEDIERITQSYNVSDKQVRAKGRELAYRIEAKGQHYKDQRALLALVAAKDFQPRTEQDKETLARLKATEDAARLNPRGLGEVLTEKKDIRTTGDNSEQPGAFYEGKKESQRSGDMKSLSNLIKAPENQGA